MIVTSHSEPCPWRQRGCGGKFAVTCLPIRILTPDLDSIFHLTLNNASNTLKALRDRYDSLCALSDKLPYPHNIHRDTGYDLETVLGYLPKDFFMNQTEIDESGVVPKVNRVAMLMALCGWHGDTNSIVKDGSASCSSCFRNLGLWLFKSKEVDEHGNMTEEATFNSGFNPIKQHRDYCPWRDGKSQSGYGTSTDLPPLPAWQVLIRVLKNNDYLSQTATSDSASRSKASDTAASSRPATAPGGDFQEEEDEKARDEKDKHRQGRLSRIKSLFDVKSSSKLQKPTVIQPKEAPI
jgi:hypothetical protein